MPDSTTHCLLDVRSPDEFAAGTIPGAVNIPIGTLRARLEELPAAKPIIIFCRVGVRGYLAARILMAKGRTDCVNLSGGYETWRLATSTQLSTASPPGDHFGGDYERLL
jgi:rhodanese-related sulfurtransferase